MANENQEQDNNQQEIPLWKKLVLPLGILLGGMVVVVVLAYLLIPGFGLKKGMLAIGPSDYPNPDSFEAPAEVSVAVQMECQASVEKINSMDKCEDQAQEFLTKADACVSYDYALEKHQSITTDGKFGDLAFSIVDCMLKQNSAQPEKVIGFLKKVKEFPEWDLTIGAASCDSGSSVDNYIEILSSADQFKCHKQDSLSDLTNKINTSDLDVLNEYVTRKHIPQLGQLDADADMTCPESIIHLKNILKKTIATKAQITQNADEKVQDNSSVYLDLAQGADHKALIRLNYDEQGCMYLDSVLTASVDQSEDGE